MDRISRQLRIGAFVWIFLSSACGGAIRGASPTPVGEILPTESAQGNAPAADTNISITPLIPITGENEVLMECQFCVNDETHAVLVLPESAYFDVVSSTPVRCITANVVNGRRILLCRGAQSISFSLNICSSSTNCLQFPVTLQPCALLQGSSLETSPSPIFLTPVNPSNNQNSEPSANTALPQPPSGNDSATPISPPPVEPTDSLPPTNEPPPPPTDEPPPTQVVEEEVVICHNPSGNPENRKTMTVSLSDWRGGHSRHGDTMGACD